MNPIKIPVEIRMRVNVDLLAALGVAAKNDPKGLLLAASDIQRIEITEPAGAELPTPGEDPIAAYGRLRAAFDNLSQDNVDLRTELEMFRAARGEKKDGGIPDGMCPP